MGQFFLQQKPDERRLWVSLRVAQVLFLTPLQALCEYLSQLYMFPKFINYTQSKNSPHQNSSRLSLLLNCAIGYLYRGHSHWTNKRLSLVARVSTDSSFFLWGQGQLRSYQTKYADYKSTASIACLLFQIYNIYIKEFWYSCSHWQVCRSRCLDNVYLNTMPSCEGCQSIRAHYVKCWALIQLQARFIFTISPAKKWKAQTLRGGG